MFLPSAASLLVVGGMILYEKFSILSKQMIAKSKVRLMSSPCCQCQPHQTPPPPRKKSYDLSHITQYLNQIEDILASSATPAIRYQHCYKSKDNQTFFKTVGATLAKPMLRTLIYANDNTDAKIHFDKRIRDSQSFLEREKMTNFMINSLRPAAEALDEDTRFKKVPGLLNGIQHLEDAIKNNNLWGRNMFSRLASGRLYKGKLQDLITDLFPELVDEYHAASQKASEREVLEHVIKVDLITEQQDKQVASSDEAKKLFESRLDAISTLLDKYYPVMDTKEETVQFSVGVDPGKQCEESCIAFLRDEYIESECDEDCIILENVNVNVRRSVSHCGHKYIPPKIHKRGMAKNKMDGSGIIWVDMNPEDGLTRHQLCSEFDAIVLVRESNNTHVHSIFEAKKTVSPSSLHDILSKKLSAIEALVENHSAELVYNNCGVTENVPFSSLAANRRLTFGVYCNEILQPENAADSVRSIAGSNVVTSSVREVIKALERDKPAVEVKLSSALHILQGLHSVVDAIQARNNIDVKIFVDDEATFRED